MKQTYPRTVLRFCTRERKRKPEREVRRLKLAAHLSNAKRSLTPRAVNRELGIPRAGFRID